MKFPYQKIVEYENETEEVAKEFIKVIKNGDIVLLNGELGSGKTFFVKSICNLLNINNASSPSFAIVNEYHNGKKIIHIDFYRIKKLSELYDLGIEDYFNDENVVFIEWAELWKEVLPSKYYEINLAILNNNKREITITKYG